MTRAHHVIPNREGGWDVLAEGEFEPIRRFRRREKAVEFAERLTRIEHAALVVHDKDEGEQDRSAIVMTPSCHSLPETQRLCEDGAAWQCCVVQR